MSAFRFAHYHAWKTGLCLCCMALSACVYQRPDFPGDWAPLETGQTDCVAISGVYANVGVWIRSDNTRSRGRLGPLLFQDLKRWDLKEAVDNVEISLTKDGILEVAAWPGNQSFVVTKQYSRNKGEYRCDGGTIQMSRSEAGSEMGMSGVSSVTTYIAKSTDGALVLRVSGVTMGLLIVVPVAGALHEWYSFERHSTATKPNLPLQPTR